MGGFEFGNVQELDSRITLITFLGVIAFVVVFDVLVGLMEYFLSSSPLYNRMIQMMYKELMLMGLVSFTIIMTIAIQKNANTRSATYEQWVAGVEFSHILIFYLTFFFVAHAFYLMRTSVVCSLSYRKRFCEQSKHLIEKVESQTERQRLIYGLPYFPFFQDIRNRVEFHLIHFLFNETYLLCDGFNFASYLSNCFDRYALKTINRSLFTWFVLMILSILNYGRIRAGFGFHYCREAPILLEERRSLASSSNAENSNELVSSPCPTMNVKLFVFFALLLVLYTCFLLLLSRMYKIRLINRIGLHGSQDYLPFLKFIASNKVVNQNRMNSVELKNEIDAVMDADEYQSEGENEFKELGMLLVRFWNIFTETINSAILDCKVLVLRFIRSKRVTSSNKMHSTILLRNSVLKHEENHQHKHVHQTSEQNKTVQDLSNQEKNEDRALEQSASPFRVGRRSSATNNKIMELLKNNVTINAGVDTDKFFQRGNKSLIHHHQTTQDNNCVPASSAITPTKMTRRGTVLARNPTGGTIEKFNVEKQQSERIGVPVTPRSTLNKTQSFATKAFAPSTRTKAVSVGCTKICQKLLEPFRSNKIADETSNEHKQKEEDNMFIDMYLFSKPILFFRAVELCIMFNCLYLAFWITNFIVICSNVNETYGWKVIGQMCMAVPILFVVPSIGYIAETCSMLTAVTELNLEVVHAVLIETEDASILLHELRQKMLQRIACVTTEEVNKMDIIHGLFSEIDKDGNGCIEHTEFRLLLKALKLTYSDERFKRLYQAVDVDGDNKIGIDEIDHLLNSVDTESNFIAATSNHIICDDDCSTLSDPDNQQVIYRGNQSSRLLNRLMSEASKTFESKKDEVGIKVGRVFDFKSDDEEEAV